MANRRGHGEGHIRERADGRYEVSVRLGKGLDGKPIRKSVYGKTKKEAAANAAKLRQQYGLGKLPTAGKLTVAEFMAQWVQHTEGSLVPRTVRNNRRWVELHINPALGHLKLKDLSSFHIQGFLDAKKKTLAPGTVAYIHAIIRSALKYASRTLRLIPENPASNVIAPKASRPVIPVLNREQAAALVPVLLEHRSEFGLCLLTILITGLREGEAFALRWSDVDWENAALHVRGLVYYEDGQPIFQPHAKTPTSNRSLALPTALLDLLKEHRQAQRKKTMANRNKWIDHNLIFCRDNGLPFRTATALKTLARLLAKANCPRVTIHQLRHSQASILLALRVPMKVIQEILGHSSILITGTIYTHVAPELHREAMQQMDTLLLGQNTTSSSPKPKGGQKVVK